MENPERLGPSAQPELDYNKPARMFTYAREKQQWLRKEWKSERQLSSAIDDLADELERYVSNKFDTLPELTIVSRDIQHTKEITGRGDHRIIESGPLPFDNDAAVAFGEHALRATLFGFHRGQENSDLRVYASTNSDDTRQFMGGIYTPLLSIGVEGSDIKLASFHTSEQIGERSKYIKEQLKEYDESVATLVDDLLKNIENSEYTEVRKLHIASDIAGELARHSELSQQFIDAVVDLIFFELDLNAPHDIHASLHRVVKNKQTVPSYKPIPQPTHFKSVVPQLGFIGESLNRGLGLFFIKNDQPVQIPVQYITNIYRSQQ